MGAYLVGLWGFQSGIVEAIGFHNQLEKYPANTFSSALAVHIANVMFYKIHQSAGIGAMPDFNTEYLQRIGMIDKLAKWQELCLDSIGSLQESEKNNPE